MNELDAEIWSQLPRETVAYILSFICCPLGHLRQTKGVDKRFDKDLCARFPVVHSRAVQKYTITTKRYHHAAMEYRNFCLDDIIFSKAPIRALRDLKHNKHRLRWWHNNF